MRSVHASNLIHGRGPELLIMHALLNLANASWSRIALRLWRDREAAEMVEWVVAVALLMVIAVVTYNNLLVGELNFTVNFIATKLQQLS